MAETYVDTSTLQSFSYDDLLNWAEIYGSSGSKYTFDVWAAECAKYGVGEEEALLSYLEGVDSGIKVEKMADGSYSGWFYNTVEQTTNTNPINSNVSTVSRGNIRQMVGQKFENIGGTLTRNMTRLPASGGLGQKAAYVLGSVGSGVAAASTGIALGKTIDGALYNAMPDYWDSIGMSSLNPETWNSITNGDDSPFAGLFNFILGLDPENGNTQMYMNEEAFAYMAYALAQNGWFDSGTGYKSYYDDSSLNFSIAQPVLSNIVTKISLSDGPNSTFGYKIAFSEPVYGLILNSTGAYDGGVATPFFISTTPFLYGSNYTRVDNDNWPTPSTNAAMTTTINGTTIYYFDMNTTAVYSREGYIPFNRKLTGTNWLGSSGASRCGTYIFDGDTREIQAIDGVGNQQDATLPDISTWDDVPSTLQSLQNQYPDLFQNPMIWDNYNDDGTANQTRWLPIPFPVATSGTDQQPVSGDQTQTSTKVDQLPQTLIDLLTMLVQETEPQTETQTETELVPQNPITTGTGTTVPVTPPTGNASALWSVYHPTQSQVNSFGAWLWGSPFLTNIGKLFQNPIDGVISLHKIFATPVDSGTGNIVVGTLDSGVSSATVNQQYVYVNCGTIDCFEDFGNVFDYPPFTQVSLYLPFIGIVPLDTNDVMRSSITVTYGVDVYTGACLAMVEISRDGNTVNLYQYAGVASVEYPLSNVQNGQLVSGLLAIGAGVASMVASGGVTAPAVGAVAAGVVTSAKSNVGKSGGFSGNSGAMGIKVPYIIIQRPQTKVADTFVQLEGYPTNKSGVLSEFSGHVVVSHVHVEGIPATDTELSQIETLLKEGILI